MKLKKALFSLFTITLLSFGGWLTILFNVDPLKADRFILISFYASVFLFVTGVASFVGFGIRVLRSHREVIYAHLTPSIRQATLLGFTAVGLLFLQSLRVLSAVDAGAFILAIFLLELFFRATPKSHRSVYAEEDQS